MLYVAWYGWPFCSCPILNSKMMSEVHVSLTNILIAWQQIAPYLFIFIVHNAFIVRYVKRHEYIRYVVVDVLFITTVFYGVDVLDRVVGDFASPTSSSAPNTPRSPTCPSTGTSCWGSS